MSNTSYFLKALNEMAVPNAQSKGMTFERLGRLVPFGEVLHASATEVEFRLAPESVGSEDFSAILGMVVFIADVYDVLLYTMVDGSEAAKVIDLLKLHGFAVGAAIDGQLPVCRLAQSLAKTG